MIQCLARFHPTLSRCNVWRIAVLVLSEDRGAAIREAAPPQQ